MITFPEEPRPVRSGGRWAFVLVIIGVVVHATIFSRAVEIQKELHAKQTALQNLSSMHEAAKELPDAIAAFDEGVAKQKQRVDALTTEWLEDLKLRIASRTVPSGTGGD